MSNKIESRRRARRVLGAALPFFCAFTALPAIAQPGVESFAPSYFAGNQPATAEEMVTLLPGFHIQNGDFTVRGFSGTVGNVLIDGQLPTSKEETADDLLKRIPASSVERIELIRGAADMHGYNVLANVVRNRGASIRGHAEAEGGITHFGTTEDKLALHLVRQGAELTLEMSGTWGRDIGTQNANGFGTRVRLDPTGAPIYLSNYSYPKLTNNSELSLAYRTPLLGGDLSTGLAYKRSRAYSGITEHIYFPAVSLSTGAESALAENSEARLDYTHDLGRWGQLQLFGVHRIIHQDEPSQTVTAAETDTSRGVYNTREDVARLAWYYTKGALKLQAGGEGSINVMTSRSTLTLGRTPVVLPAANIRLEEKRFEGFTSATYRFNPALMTELGARYETSGLTQTGDSTLSRNLSFFKPRWLTTWDPLPGNEFRFLLERQVGQLNFRDFSASTSLNSNTVTGGNKNLEPARSWNVAVDWEKQIFGKGSLVLEVRREMISHVVDKIPVFSGGKAFTAVGNIGYGYRDGVQANIIASLDSLGLKGVTVNIEADWHHSRVRDAATGLYRQITGGQTGGTEFQFNTVDEITYDMPARKLRLGMDFHNHANSQEREFRVDEIDDTTHGFKLGFFVDYKPTPAWTIRLFDRDIAQTAAYRDRTVYSGLRGTAPISYFERRQLSNGAVVGLDIQHDL